MLEAAEEVNRGKNAKIYVCLAGFGSYFPPPTPPAPSLTRVRVQQLQGQLSMSGCKYTGGLSAHAHRS